MVQHSLSNPPKADPSKVPPSPHDIQGKPYHHLIDSSFIINDRTGANGHPHMYH